MIFGSFFLAILLIKTCSSGPARNQNRMNGKRYEQRIRNLENKIKRHENKVQMLRKELQNTIMNKQAE